MNSSWPNLLALQRLDFSQAALVAWSAAEASDQKGLDQFPGKRRTDHFSAQTKHIHVVILYALMSRENIMDQPGTHAGDFIRGDGSPHTAAAKGHSAVHFARCYGPGKGNDEVGVVIFGVHLVCAKVHNFVP